MGKARWDIPVCIVVPYLAMVYVTRKKIPAHPFGGLVDALFCAWNFGISLFSAWGTWNLGGAVLTGLRTEGLYYTICTDTHSILRLGDGRHGIPDSEAQGGAFPSVVPSCRHSALLLARAGHGVHSGDLVRGDELFCALDHVHVLLPDDLQVDAEDAEGDRTLHHHHPDRPDVLGSHRERHRRGLVLRWGLLPDQSCDGLPLCRDVRLLRLALLEALLRCMTAKGKSGKLQGVARSISRAISTAAVVDDDEDDETSESSK